MREAFGPGEWDRDFASTKADVTLIKWMLRIVLALQIVTTIKVFTH